MLPNRIRFFPSKMLFLLFSIASSLRALQAAADETVQAELRTLPRARYLFPQEMQLALANETNLFFIAYPTFASGVRSSENAALFTYSLTTRSYVSKNYRGDLQTSPVLADDGKSVFLISAEEASDSVICVDAVTLEIKWEWGGGTNAPIRFHQPSIGPDGTVYVSGNKRILAGGMVFAIKPESGALKWQTALSTRYSQLAAKYISPITFDSKRNTLLIGYAPDLLALSPEDGSTLWRTGLVGEDAINLPLGTNVVVAQLNYSGTNVITWQFDSGRPIYPFQPVFFYDNYLTCIIDEADYFYGMKPYGAIDKIDLAGKRLVWSIPEDLTLNKIEFLTDDHLLYCMQPATNGFNIVALSPTNGEEIYSHRVVADYLGGSLGILPNGNIIAVYGDGIIDGGHRVGSNVKVRTFDGYGTKGLSSHGWPRSRADFANSGRTSEKPYPIMDIVIRGETNLFAGELLHLDAGLPPESGYEYQWFFNNYRIYGSDAVLEIEHITADKSGAYYVEARDPVQTYRSGTVFVNVMTVPRFQRVTLGEGGMNVAVFGDLSGFKLQTSINLTSNSWTDFTFAVTNSVIFIPFTSGTSFVRMIKAP